MRTGRIPEKIAVALKPAKDSKGDGTPHHSWSFPAPNCVTKGFGMYTASPAFVAPADSEKSVESAKAWAGGSTWWNKKTKLDKHEFQTDIPNTPFRGLRWVGIDSRMEGGVAYKVVTPQGWLVDLREDVIIECLYEGCIKGGVKGPNGVGTYLDTQFVWVQIGSQTRLVKVGSDLHKEMSEATERRTLAKISRKDLEVGGVYCGKDKRETIYLGKFKGELLLLPLPRPYSWNRETRKIDPQEQLDGQVGIVRGSDDSTLPVFRTSKSVSFVEKVGMVNVPSDLADCYEKKLAIVRKKIHRFDYLRTGI